jgi:hypothetical protein
MSYPLAVESRTSYLFDRIYPSFWISLAIANIGLFFIASSSSSRWERLACAFAFFAFAYSLKYFFTFLAGPDSDYFRALTENFTMNRLSLPEERVYYQWPLLFILAAMTSHVLEVSVEAVSSLLFQVWTFLLAAGLFLYANQRNDVWDFLSPVIYGIVTYPFLVWQYSAQTYALVLAIVCVNLMSKNVRSYRVPTVLVYVALVFSHAFFAIFLIIAAAAMALRNRRYAILAISFGVIYGLYVTFESTVLVQDLATIIHTSIFSEYSILAKATLEPQAVSALDGLGQTISRFVTLSMWALLAFLILSLLVLRRLRSIDISLAISGIAYAIAGAVVPVLGWRSFQVLAIPGTYAVRHFPTIGSVRKILLAYFFLALAIFPLTLVHLYYNDTNYMTLREQQALTIFIPMSRTGGETQLRILARSTVRGYAEAISSSDIWWIDETYPAQLSATWFNFIFMSPELEKALLKTGLSESELLGFEEGMLHFSTVYSNGHVRILMNSNATAPPGVGA